MKDIDFDELDKAVNSLMASTPTPAASDSAATSVVPSQPAPAAAVPVQLPATEPAIQAPTPTVARPAAPAIKRSGRFMDMVSTPSETRQARPATVASREGLSITPRPSDETVKPVEPVVEAPAQNETIVPDPIEFSQNYPQEQPTELSAEPDTTEAQADTTMLPSESPFIADAKVEKRPLNAGMPESATPDLSADFTAALSQPSAEAAVEQSDENGKDEPPITPQVAELSSDLVAIESAETLETTQAVDTSGVASVGGGPAVPLGAASIVQQYTQKPSTGDQSHAAIYDASQYPEPVSHPAKTKSGWLWIVWVLLLLGVGAGGAVLLYNLGIIP